MAEKLNNRIIFTFNKYFLTINNLQKKQLSLFKMSSKALIKVLRTSSSTKSLPLYSRQVKGSPFFSCNEVHTSGVEKNQMETSKDAQIKIGDGKTDTTISKAMTSYLQRAKEHQEFISKQEREFVFGRRHLANMMGKDPETFNQADINEAIKYLFPSGLYEPKARPMMKPPQEIYPKQKAAQFDVSGRPHHPFFFTAKPNFFYLMHEMVGKLNDLNKSASSLTNYDTENDTILAGTAWLSKEEMESRLLERVTDKQYLEWINCMERLAYHPKRDKELEFIKAYRKPLAKQTIKDEIPPITLESDGRKSCYVGLCMKKSARGEVKVTVPGTGKFNINGQGLEFFKMIQSREAVITPLQLIGWLGKADIDAYIFGGRENVEHVDISGESARAGCLRWGIATALAGLGADTEKLRLAGLLVRDHRQRERTKCGKTGPRGTWTWKKR